MSARSGIYFKDGKPVLGPYVETGWEKTFDKGFSGSHMPTSSSPYQSGYQSPMNTGPQALPLAGGGYAFSDTQKSQIQNALSAAGVWDTIVGFGGDVWDTISKILPKNADGSIDWAGALKDVGSWVKDNKGLILDSFNAVNQYQRSQKSDQYAKQALDLATQHYNDKAPLRAAGQAGMLNPQANAPDISGLRAQGQNGLSVKAPTPLPLATGALNNAGVIANGSRSGNPFTKALPLATSPTSPPVATLPPSTSPPPALPIAPSPINPSAPPGLAPTPAQLEGPHIPAPFSAIPAGFGQTRQPGQRIKPLPIATY